MMPRNILVIDAHPDSNPKRFCTALATAYAEGAEAAGHSVRRFDIAAIDFPLLRSREQFESADPPDALKAVADSIRWADHLVFVFPLWLGTMPALLKALLEQVLRPGTAFSYPSSGKGGFATTLLDGRSARLIVTMGMPAFAYRIWYLGHGLAVLRRNILNFVGIRPVRQTLIGMVEAASDAKRRNWVERIRRLGQTAS